jgi:hypothetical protein
MMYFFIKDVCNLFSFRYAHFFSQDSVYCFKKNTENSCSTFHSRQSFNPCHGFPVGRDCEKHADCQHDLDSSLTGGICNSSTSRLTAHSCVKTRAPSPSCPSLHHRLTASLVLQYAAACSCCERAPSPLRPPLIPSLVHLSATLSRITFPTLVDLSSRCTCSRCLAGTGCKIAQQVGSVHAVYLPLLVSRMPAWLAFLRGFSQPTFQQLYQCQQNDTNL